MLELNASSWESRGGMEASLRFPGKTVHQGDYRLLVRPVISSRSRRRCPGSDALGPASENRLPRQAGLDVVNEKIAVRQTDWPLQSRRSLGDASSRSAGLGQCRDAVHESLAFVEFGAISPVPSWSHVFPKWMSCGVTYSLSTVASCTLFC